MFASLSRATALVREVLTQLDPGRLRSDDAVKLLEAMAEIEKLAVAGRTLLAARAAESRAWQREGHRTAASWLSSKTDMPVGTAVTSIETASRLEQLPATREAFRRGELTEARAVEIAGAAAAAPDMEQELLSLATTGSLRELRDSCRRARANAAPDELSRYEAIRKTRYLRWWSDPEGAVRLDARLTPDAGAAVIAAIDERKDAIFRDARRAGRRESYAAYAADALVALATEKTDERGSRPRAMIHVRVDHSALVRGSAQANETCEIAGVGPIPVATAKALASDAFLKVLVTDSLDVRAVAHAGRTIPVHLRTAVEARDQTCVAPGCDVDRGLEIDHRVPFSDGGSTSLENLGRLCGWHHYLKTHCGHRLEGDPGRWRWLTPDAQEGTPTEGRAPPAA